MTTILAYYKRKFVFNVFEHTLKCFFSDTCSRMTRFCPEAGNIPG